MTASELAKYFASRAYFVDPDQEVRFVLSPDGVPLEKGDALEIRGSVVPERGGAVVDHTTGALVPEIRYTGFPTRKDAERFVLAQPECWG